MKKFDIVTELFQKTRRKDLLVGKYEPLANYLENFEGESWDASFADIEKILGFKLPPSAHGHRAWWANQFKGHHSQAKGWIQAGWVTKEIDQRRGRVRFERRSRRSHAASDDIWRRAELMTGITDRDELQRAAVNALIQREAARALVSLGGTMPDLVVPERERPRQ